MNLLHSLFNRAPQQDDLGVVQQKEKQQIQAYWAWLRQPLDPAFVISPSENFKDTARALLKLTYKYSHQRPSQITLIAQALLRRYIFSFYYANYQNPAWLQSLQRARTEGDQFHVIAALDSQVEQSATQIVQEFVFYLVQAIGSDETAVQIASQIINHNLVNPSEICELVTNEMRGSGLIPRIPSVPSVPPSGAAAPEVNAAAAPEVNAAAAPEVNAAAAPERLSEKQDISSLMAQNVLNQPDPPNTITNIEFSPTDNQKLHLVGAAIQGALNEKLGSNKAQYIPTASGGSEIYYASLIFQLDKKIDPSSVNGIMPYVLSVGGFDPEAPYQIKPLKNNQVAIDLPIYERQTNQLVQFLVTETNTMSLYQQKRMIEMIQTWGTYLNNLLLTPQGGLRFLVGINAHGDLVTVPIINSTGSGLIIAGRTRSGKSAQVLSLVSQIGIASTPDEVRIAGMDFKGKAQTLSLIGNSPHVWEPPLYEEWINLAKRHNLNTSDPDFKQLWSEDDLDIKTIAVWKESDASRLLAAMERECLRRSYLISRYNLQNIFEFNEMVQAGKDSKVKPIPLLPFFLEEGGAYAELIGTNSACSQVERMICRWGAYGIPVIITVQDGKDRSALPPTARGNVASKIVLLSESIEANKRLLGSPIWAEAATRLSPIQDAIVRGDNGFDHVHLFYVGSQDTKGLVTLQEQHHGKRRKVVPSSSGIFFPESKLDELDELDELVPIDASLDQERYEKLISILEHNEAIEEGRISGSRITQKEALIQLVGVYRCSNYKDGDASRVNSGNNAKRAIAEIQELAKKFGLSISEFELKAMRRVEKAS